MLEEEKMAGDCLVIAQADQLLARGQPGWPAGRLGQGCPVCQQPRPVQTKYVKKSTDVNKTVVDFLKWQFFEMLF